MFFVKRLSHEAVFLLIVGLLFFLLRFPSLFEPYWYGDEGIYFTLGRALQEGRALYTEIWDNKPPLLYALYTVFNDLFSIRLASIFFGIASVMSFFLLSRAFFTKKHISYTATLLFSLFLALPTLEGNIANAENFLLLPVTAAAFLFWLATEKIAIKETITQKEKRFLTYLLFSSGFLLGIASLFKIVAVFDFSAFLLFAVFLEMSKTRSLQKTVVHSARHYAFYIIGFFIPLLLTGLIFLLQGSFVPFLETLFLRNVSYIGEKNAFFIPQGFLVVKFTLLLLALFFLFGLRKNMSRKTLFVLIWLAFSLFNTYFSQRPYIHYQLVLLPSLALAVGMMLTYKTVKKKLLLSLLVSGVIILLYNTFPRWKTNTILPYYHNFLSFLTDKKSITDYQAFFDRNTPRDYAVADYLALHTDTGDEVFIWGNSPQIYYLSGTLPAGRYAASYHISTKPSLEETEQLLRDNPPRYLIIMPGTELFPFTIPQYSYKLTIIDSAIYERIN